MRYFGEQKPSLESLIHFGVKGMRWGVRKDQPTSSQPGDENITIGKGNRLLNISSDAPRNLSGHVYTAHTKRDVVNYRGKYAYNLTMFKEADKVFSNSFTVTKAIKAAGRKEQVEAFKTLWEKDRDGVARALAESQKDMKFIAAFNARVLKLDREDVYHNRIMKKGENWVNKKGTQEFISSLGTETNKGRALYFQEMKKRGYNAIVDLNDIKNYGSEEPLLIFNGKDNLKRKSTVELSPKQIEKAQDAYFSEEKLKEYRDNLHD